MNSSAKRVAISGMLTSLMLVLGLIERQFPITAAIPGIKLGLANSVLIYALYMMNAKQALILVFVKVLIQGLIYGNMQSMIYSLAGGLLSLLAMYLMKKVKGISPVGVSVAGACFFNVGQTVVAAFILNSPLLIVSYLPILLISAIVTGVLTGVIASMVMKHLRYTHQ